MADYSIKEFVGGPEDGGHEPDDGSRGAILRNFKDRSGRWAIYKYGGDRIDGNVAKRLFTYRRSCTSAEISDLFPGFGSPQEDVA